MIIWSQFQVIKEILDGLPEQDRRQLYHAFENEFSQYIRIGTDRFLGVNVRPIKHLEITESAGAWAYGKIKGKPL